MKTLLIAIVLVSTYCLGQQWTGVLDPLRAVDWSLAGAGAIPNRTVICTTESPGVSLATLNADIAACPANQVVFLSAGTYGPYTNEILVDNVSNITLRGAGPNQTIIKFSTHGNGNGLGAAIYAQGTNPDYSGGPDNVCNWIANYSRGTTSITLGTCPTGALANLKVGSLLKTDQLDDSSDPAPTYPYVCQTKGAGLCTTEGASGANGGRPGRAQNQQVVVTNISGSTITFTPGLYDSNWRSGQTPQVWFSTNLPVTGVGFENFTVDTTAITNGAYGIFQFDNVTYSWIKNVRSVNANTANAAHKHVWLYQSSHNTVRDSYFVNAAGASESYGVDSSFSSSDNLVENNICQHVATCTIQEGDVGSVFSYYYAIDNFYDTTFQQLDCSHHGAYDHLALWEGNQGSGCGFDNTHGYSFGETMFRNRYSGFDVAGGGVKNAQTIPVQYYMGSRFGNVIGNVLGLSAYHSIYQSNPSSGTDCGNLGNGNVSVFLLGWSQTEGSRYADLATCPSGLGGTFVLSNDTSVATNVMRWGNYDTVNAANRFVNAEVPSGLSAFANPVPGSQTLPNSFYLNAKPAFWGTPYGTPPWPPIGPDVTGGNVAGLNGRANNIPAQQCFANAPADTNYGTTATLTSCSESGSTVTCTANATLNSAFAVGYLVNVANNGVAGYNVLGGYPITAKTSTTFSYTNPTTGLATGSGGTATVNPVFQFDSSTCYYAAVGQGAKIQGNLSIKGSVILK